MSTTSDSKPKRHSSAAEKAKLVREGVKDGVAALFSESQSRMIPSMPQAQLVGVPHALIGEVTTEPVLAIDGLGVSTRVTNAALKDSWQALSRAMAG